MKTLYLLPLAAGLMLMACSKEESPAPDGGQGGSEPVEHSVTVTIADEFSSKTAFDGNILSWAEGDKLEMYTAEETYEYVLQDNNGTFKSELTPEGEVLYAAYPAENAVYSAAGLTFTLPSEIAYSETGFVCPLYAEIGKTASELGTVGMSIPVGLINVNYTGVPTGYSSLVVTSAGSRVSGAFNLKDGMLSTIPTSGTNVTTVSFEPLTAPKDMSFYIPVPVGTYSSITFKLTGDGVDEVMVAEMQDMAVERAVIYPLSARQDLSIKWGAIAEEDLEFPYGGASRDYPVVANTDWTVTSDNPEITAVKKDASTVTVTVPAGKYLGGLAAELKLSSADPSIIIAPDVVNVSQAPNPDYTVLEGSDAVYNPDGSVTLSIYPEAEGVTQVSKSYLVASERTKYGTYTFDFTEIDLSAGFFSLECWFTSGNIQFQLGYFNRIYYADTFAGISGTSLYFDAVSYEALKSVKQVQVKMFPSTNPELGPETDNDMTTQIFIDGTLHKELSMGSNTWGMPDEERGGTAANFGLNSRPDDQALISSSLTIKSYTYSPEY